MLSKLELNPKNVPTNDCGTVVDNKLDNNVNDTAAPNTTKPSPTINSCHVPARANPMRPISNEHVPKISKERSCLTAFFNCGNKKALVIDQVQPQKDNTRPYSSGPN